MLCTVGQATCTWSIAHVQLRAFGHPSIVGRHPDLELGLDGPIQAAATTEDKSGTKSRASADNAAHVWVAEPAAHRALQQGAARLLQGHPNAALKLFQGAQEFAFLPCLLVRHLLCQCQLWTRVHVGVRCCLQP